jgi:hypothetical protein
VSAPWIAAFALLALAVAVVVLVVVGLARRVIPLLEELERQGGADLPELGAAVGETVAPFSLSRRDGSRVEWESFVESRAILLVVEAGCMPCRELPVRLEEVDGELHGVPIVVVADDPADDLVAELEQRWPVLYDAGDARAALRNRATPQAYLVDDDGTILGRTIPNSPDVLLRMIHSAERRFATAP